MAAPFHDPWLMVASFIRRGPTAPPSPLPVENPDRTTGRHSDRQVEPSRQSRWDELTLVGFGAAGFLLSAGCVAYLMVSMLR